MIDHIFITKAKKKYSKLQDSNHSTQSYKKILQKLQKNTYTNKIKQKMPKSKQETDQCPHHTHQTPTTHSTNTRSSQVKPEKAKN